MRQKNAFMFEEDVFAENTQIRTFIKHKALLLMKRLKKKPQNKTKHKSFYDLCCTIIKNLSDEEGEN